MSPTTVRTIALWCPDWPIVVAEADPTMPAAVLRANRVIACTPAAAAEGVRVDQRRREAQRHCPHLILVPHAPDAEAEAFEPVVRAVGRFTPRLEILEPGECHLGARGPSRHFGGEAALAADLAAGALTVALEVGPSARVAVGVADGRFAAAVAARLAAAASTSASIPGSSRTAPVTGVGRTTGPAIHIVEPGASAAFLEPLEIAWLHRLGESDADTIDRLARLGLRRLGELAALDPAVVLARFGRSGTHLHRLAAGLDDRAPDTIAPPEPLDVEIALDGPVDRLEPLVFAAKTLADRLTGKLRGEGIVCTRLAVAAETENGERDERVWHRSGGLGAADMVERVRWQLTGWLDAGGPTAGITRLHLEPVEIRGDTGEQASLWGGTSEADERAVRAVARLTTLVGDHAVLVPSWRGGRLPAERCAWVPAAPLDLLDHHETRQRLGPLAEPVAPSAIRHLHLEDTGGGGSDRIETVQGGRRRRTRARGDDPAAAPWPGSLPAPAPTVVLSVPEPAVLADADGHPVQVNGRGEPDREPALFSVGDRVPRLVVAWAGPWLVDERWWEPARRRRLARMQILCDDGAAHLVAIERRRWWLLAAYR